MSDRDKDIPVKVAVRCRPFSDREKAEGSQQCVQFFAQQNQLTISGKTFAYDYIFDTQCSQDAVYEDCALPLLDRIFKGYNATIFAYGQTGSGKTYTMGTEMRREAMHDAQRGIIPRLVSEVFSRIVINKSATDYKYTVKCSMLEIYEEKVIDLLAGPGSQLNPLPIREANGGVFVQGLSTTDVADLAGTISCLEKGCDVRSKGQTAMNQASSRSHAIFTLTVTQICENDESASWCTALNLVDLAGSERLKKTQADGVRRREGIKINEGLLALGNVISALTDPTIAANGHVPYRNSKLTRLLQDSLGGNSHTLMVACISPADTNCEETVSTLRYAERAKKIKNKPIVNQDSRLVIIRQLKEELAMVKAELALRGGGMGCVLGGADTAQTQGALNDDERLELVRTRRALEEANEEKETMSTRLIHTMDEKTRLMVACDSCESVLLQMQSLVQPFVDGTAAAHDTNTTAQVMVQVRDHTKRVMHMLRKAACEEEPDALDSTQPNTHNRTNDASAPKTGMKRMNSTASLQSDADEDDEDTSIASLPELKGERERRYVERQSQVSSEISDLMRQIQKKEREVEQYSNSCQQLTQLNSASEEEKKELNTKISSLADELERVKAQKNKVSEQRRQRMMELEKELNEKRKKLMELNRLEKYKAEQDKNMLKLTQEIQKARTLRVQLMKSLATEQRKFNQKRIEAERQLSTAKRQEEKTKRDAARAKQTFQSQQNVLNRKYEEAVRCNKRLQQQLQRQEMVRQSKFTEHDLEKLSNEVKSYLDEEFNLVTGIEDARVCLDNLMAQRRGFNRRLGQANRKLAKLTSAQPPNKKRSASSTDGDDPETAIATLQQEVTNIQKEISLRNSEIEQLQARVTTFDSEPKDEQRWSRIHTIIHAKCALKHIFDMAVDERQSCLALKQQLHEMETTRSELIQSNKELVQEKKTMEKGKAAAVAKVQKELDEMEHNRQLKETFLLSSLVTAIKGEQLSGSELAQLTSMKSTLPAVQSLMHALEEKQQENQRLTTQLSQGSARPRGMFKQVVSASNLLDRSDACAFEPIVPQVQTTRSSRLSRAPERLGMVQCMTPVRESSSGDLTTGSKHSAQGPITMDMDSVDDSDYSDTAHKPIKRHNSKSALHNKPSNAHRKRSLAATQEQPGDMASDDSLTANGKTAVNTTFVKCSSEDEESAQENELSGTGEALLNTTYTSHPPTAKRSAAGDDVSSTPFTSHTGLCNPDTKTPKGPLFKQPF